MNKLPASSNPDIRSILLRNIALYGLTLLVVTFAFASSVAAQDEDDFAPPVKVLPKAEKEQLAGQSDIKNRTRLSLTLMETRLIAAEKFTALHDPNSAFRELGVFEALIADSLDHLGKNDPEKGKTLDAFKRFEIGIRPFMARLESIRRELPLGCDEYIRAVMVGLRDARAKAVDPLFSNSVVKVKGDN